MDFETQAAVRISACQDLLCSALLAVDDPLDRGSVPENRTHLAGAVEDARSEQHGRSCQSWTGEHLPTAIAPYLQTRQFVVDLRTDILRRVDEGLVLAAEIRLVMEADRSGA